MSPVATIEQSEVPAPISSKNAPCESQIETPAPIVANLTAGIITIFSAFITLLKYSYLLNFSLKLGILAGCFPCNACLNTSSSKR